MAYEHELEFYKQLQRLEKERAAAFEARSKDPARWQKAKHAYAEFRTAMRVLGGRQAGVSAVVVAQTAQVNVAAENAGGE
jgi:hypothetical protein